MLWERTQWRNNPSTPAFIGPLAIRGAGGHLVEAVSLPIINIAQRRTVTCLRVLAA